jgi:catechol 2,3-dioxygenase-like lactoylglutathione lyase family enzyme
MKRTWPIIAVEDVVKSSAWYTTLLNAKNNHAGGNVFDQILDEDGTILLCLHYWGPSGRNGDHYWPPLSSRINGPPENGLLLWFVVDDFDAAWVRARNMGASIEEPPNDDNGTRMRTFVIRDFDRYYVAVNEARPETIAGK